MATGAITLSSPLQNHTSSIFTMSSSPSLPSLTELFKKPPALRTGSRATPVPASANATFTSASSLLRTAQPETRGIASTRTFQVPADLDELEQGSKSKAKELSAKAKARKPRAKKLAEGNEVLPKKPAAKRKKANSKDDEEPAVKEKVQRKPRAKKAESQTEPKLPKARVTKSTSGTSRTTKRVTKKALALIEAEVANGRSIAVTSKDISSDTAVATAATPKLLPTKKFSSLMNTFRNEEDSRQHETTERESLGTTKRKSPEISKPDLAPAKPKAARKKPKTITDQATAAYITEVAETTETLKKPGAITDFFQRKEKSGDGERSSLGKLPISSRLKPGEKGFPIVLQSPESAIKEINEQEVLFGSSSQLARESSPSFLRDLNRVIRESNAIENDFWTDSSFDSSKSTSTSQRILSRIGRSNLWGASSRDPSGNLVDIVDLSKTPAPKVTSKATHLMTDENATEPVRMSTELPNGPGDAISLDTPDAKCSVGNSYLPEPQNPVINIEKPAIDNSGNTPKSKPLMSKPRARKAVPTEKPDYSTYTSEKLTKTVASFGFKAVKKREQMILLLNRCWEGQHGGKPEDDIPSGEASTSTIKPLKEVGKSKSATASKVDPLLKKPRGRPKKVVEVSPSLPTKSTVSSKPKSITQVKKAESDSEDKPLKLRKAKPKRKAEDEISDSDSATTRSPSRRKKSRKTMPKVAPKLSENAESSESTSESLQAETYLHITRAIKAIPPSTSSSDPNWYEKMLLYDPIVLEDLTIWLNTGGLESVGWDGEVCPSEVKGWCESKSVCCLWRENLRGGARSRY